jgi:hypothetical protein
MYAMHIQFGARVALLSIDAQLRVAISYWPSVKKAARVHKSNAAAMHDKRDIY